ncbi:MAG: hypothetical protein K0R63_752 [Rickettsiales bacterium]|jgi:hypothetical protein|nr:hypothetical protein [Rickettsiales bacterium]
MLPQDDNNNTRDSALVLAKKKAKQESLESALRANLQRRKQAQRAEPDRDQASSGQAEEPSCNKNT